jgi:hypothetical protein
MYVNIIDAISIVHDEYIIHCTSVLVTSGAFVTNGSVSSCGNNIDETIGV